MPVYVILTSKPGQFRTEAGDGLRPVEAWDFMQNGHKRAGFVIAEMTGMPRVTIVDETPPEVVNRIPSKLLERFPSIDRARREIEGLTRGSTGYTLRPAGADTLAPHAPGAPHAAPSTRN